jgi:hypothetical protein
MTCGRCDGLMILEVTAGNLEDPMRSESRHARCLNCGNVEDSVISLNRRGLIPAHGAIARVRECIRL